MFSTIHWRWAGSLCCLLLFQLPSTTSMAQMTLGVTQMPRDGYMKFASDQSMFYYNDIGIQNGYDAILIAGNANAGGSMTYTINDTVTSEDLSLNGETILAGDTVPNSGVTYIIGHESNVYISKDYQDLVTHAGAPDTGFDPQYLVQINSPNAGPNAALSMVMMQLQCDNSSDRIMYVGGLGIAIIEDVDPNTYRGLEIPNDVVFTIHTVPVDPSQCGNSGNHCLEIEW